MVSRVPHPCEFCKGGFVFWLTRPRHVCTARFGSGSRASCLPRRKAGTSPQHKTMRGQIITYCGALFFAARASAIFLFFCALPVDSHVIINYPNG